ncbi:hypothetical protein [Pigmentiphaga kullae]|uniref:Uncharacterized protein n=1 Tax=Pigmentiphaga kullae TaxID=151784 RepID=A0A4Q7ND72_9BURK|nr:hypothetical protein [Pigmentiphaga kullae]RZS80617.1 hypothetical protein EV675_3229 [Pigmentiphaga kullae]
MHMQTIPARRRTVRLPSSTVPRADYESACAARDIARGLYERQTLALHQRSVELMNANDEIHRLRLQMAAHGIDPDAQP